MNAIEVFRLMPVEVQLALVIGGIAIILLLACSRSAGDNLLAFFRGCCSLFGWQPRRQSSRVVGQHVSGTRDQSPKGDVKQVSHQLSVPSHCEGNVASDQ